MPHRDPAWWRAMFDHAPSIIGGFLAGLLHLFVVLAGPRPFPPGRVVAGLIEAAIAWLVGGLCGVFLGPLIAHMVGIDAATAPEAFGGVRVLVAFLGWKVLPVLRDKITDAIPATIDKAVDAIGGLFGRKAEGE